VRLHTLNALIGFIFLAVAMDGRTSDGVLEINQACALNGGCFSGDAAGFPVTIDGSAGVSYRLTGSLDLTAHPTLAAISISKAYVTLDLNGFEIAGVASCELAPGGFDWDCAPRNSGAHGIALASGAESVTIKDGTIRNMPDDGISGSGARLIRVQGITASENAGWGVLLGNQSMISESSARLNDQGGFSVQDDAIARRCGVFQWRGQHLSRLQSRSEFPVLEQHREVATQWRARAMRWRDMHRSQEILPDADSA
jgi:hypothetical protein